MTVPKWLAVTWAVAIVLGSMLYMVGSQGSVLQPNPIGIDGVLITWVFMATALATGIWLLTRGSTLVKFDVILWFVALWVARLLTHLGPAQSQPPGQKFYSSILGPPITLVVAGVVMVIAWVVQKHRKTGATQ